VEEEKIPKEDSEPIEETPTEAQEDQTDPPKEESNAAEEAAEEATIPSTDDAPSEDTLAAPLAQEGENALDELVEELPEAGEEATEDVAELPAEAVASEPIAEDTIPESEPEAQTASGPNAFLEDLIGTYRENVAAELEIAINEKYAQELKLAKETIESLHQEISSCRDAIESHTGVTDDAALAAERDKLTEAQKEIVKLKQQKNTLRATEEMQKRTVDIYKTNYNDLQTQLRGIKERLNDPEEDASALKEEIARLEEAINKERVQREEGEAEVERLRTKRNTLNATIEAQKRASDIYETNYRSLKEKIKDLQSQLDNPDNDPVKLKQEVATLTENLAEEHVRIQKLHQKTEALEEEKQELVTALATEKDHGKELEAALPVVADTKDLEADLKKQKDIAHDFEEKLKVSQVTLSDLEKKLKDSTKKDTQSDQQAELQEAAAVKLQQEKEYLAAQLEILRTEKGDLEKQFTQAKQDITALETAMKEKTAAPEKVVDPEALKPLQEELDTLTKERKTLLTAREEEMAMIQHALKAHKEEKEKLLTEIETLKK